MRSIKKICRFCTPDKTIVPSQYYLRVIGLVCCCIAVIEFGVGGRTSTYLSNVNNGAWWSTVAVFLAGGCALVGANKAWVQASCLLSSFGLLTALVGAIVDSVAQKAFSQLSSCGTVPSGSAVVTAEPSSFYGSLVAFGNMDGKTDISYCMASFKMLNQFEYDRCYCVTASGGFCGGYSLSKSLNTNCGSVLTTYTRDLTASLSFCCLAAIVMFCLFVFTSFLLCSKRFLTVDTVRELFPLTAEEEQPRNFSEFELGIVDKKKDAANFSEQGDEA